MPTYQYKCTECDEPLEARQSFSDAALTECPACGGQLRKVFNAVGVVFKGSGFYRNDSRSAESSTSSTVNASDSKSESTGDGSKSETKGDGSKSETKSDSGSKSSDTSNGSKSETSKSSTSKSATPA